MMTIKTYTDLSPHGFNLLTLSVTGTRFETSVEKRFKLITTALNFFIPYYCNDRIFRLEVMAMTKRYEFRHLSKKQRCLCDSFGDTAKTVMCYLNELDSYTEEQHTQLRTIVQALNYYNQYGIAENNPI
jgi:hypothetical protein